MGNKKEKSSKGFLKAIIAILVLLIILAIAIIGFLFYTNARAKKDVNNHLKNADNYIDDLKYDLAIAELKDAIEIDPKNEKAYLKLADAYCAKADNYIEKAEYDEALECYEDAMEILEDSRDYIESDKIDDRIEEIEDLIDDLEEEIESVEQQAEAKAQPEEEVAVEEDFVIVEPEDEPNTQVYEVLGAASLANGDAMVLTPANFYCSGAIWCDEEIDATKPFSIEVDICADQGSIGDISEEFINGKTTGADGFVINFSPSISVGNTGTSMGFCGYTGIELDTYPFGSGDPEEQHIALIEGSTTNHVASMMCGEINDEAWHHVKISYDDGTFEVFYDGKRVLEGESVLEDQTYVGVTAATGSACNRHMIRNLKITTK